MQPYVICHMMMTVDGRILPDKWHPALPPESRSLYEEIHERLGGDAWMVGRVTGQEFTERTTSYDDTDTVVERTHWFAQREAEGWAIVVDARGKIAWSIGDVGGDALVVILTEAVSDQHLVGLRQDGVSYIFAGTEAVDFAAALETLNQELGITRLLLEGGGGINGSLLQAGLVDELSIIIAPAVEGIRGGPALFDIHGSVGAVAGMDMTLEHCEVLIGDCVWLRYRFSWVV